MGAGMSYDVFGDGERFVWRLTEEEVAERVDNEAPRFRPRAIRDLQSCWLYAWQMAQEQLAQLQNENVRLSERTSQLAQEVADLKERKWPQAWTASCSHRA